VFAGLATTKNLVLSVQTSLAASPYCLKIAAFLAINSDLSIPAFLGKPPTQITRSQSLKATLGSSEISVYLNSGKAQSSSSILTPLSDPKQGVISSNFKWI
jgi:hypothetical protein